PDQEDRKRAVAGHHCLTDNRRGGRLPIAGAIPIDRERSDMSEASCVIGIIMGSQSDWETMQHAAQTLDRLDIGYETRVASAHRTPERGTQYAGRAQWCGYPAFIV